MHWSLCKPGDKGQIHFHCCNQNVESFWRYVDKICYELMQNCVISQFVQPWLAGFRDISSVSAFLPCKLTWDQGAKTHSQSLPHMHPGVLGPLLLTSEENVYQSRLESICSKTGHKLRSEFPHEECKSHRSPRREGPWVRPCNPMAVTLSGVPGAGTGETLLHQQCLGLTQ